VAGGDLDRPVPDIGTPAAASFGPADPTSVTMAGETRGTVAGSVGPEAVPSDLGSALASEPSFGPLPDPHAVTGASDAPREGIHRMAPAIPGYETLGELGRGGMGVVYRARQVRLNRPCALKMILAGAHATPEAAARFLAEAAAIAKLQHHHIVQIHHIGEAEGLPFFELELLPGGSLDQKLDGTPWPPGRAAHLAEQLARGIAAAHALGVVHRDLKPANVLLAADGAPKITDFGLAKALDSESGLTRSEAILGSPSYMAPEQAGGKTKGAGPAADVYALGAILYELLVGRPPFRGATILETLEQVKTVEPVPPSRLVPRLPRDIETIGLKCLQKDPSRRYESAAALAEDLRRYQAGEPIVARPVGSVERTWRWCRRNPAVAVLAAGVAVLLVAVAASASVAAVQYGLAAQNEERLRTAAEDRARAEAMAKQELEASLYFHRIALAHRELSADNLGQALKLLDDCPGDLRGWEWLYLRRLCAVEPTVLRGTAEVHGVAFHPAGELLAAGGGDGTVKIWDWRAAEVIRALPGHKGNVFSVAFRPPDGRYLASAADDQSVRLWDVTTGREVFRRTGPRGDYAGMAYAVAFSHDGRLLAAGSEDGGAIIWDAADGTEVRRLPEQHEGTTACVAFSPDGRLLVTATWAGVMRIWDARTYQVLHTIRGHGHRISAVAFRPDGRWLATASQDRTVRVWDAASGDLLSTLSGHVGVITGLAFSPDGRRLFSSGGEDKVVKTWDPQTGREILNLRGHTHVCHGVASDPEGRRLASASGDGTIRIWDAAPLEGNEGQAALTLAHDHEVWSGAFSPDGHRLASACWDGTVRLWDASTGAPLRTLAHPRNVFHVSFSPDGRQLAAAAIAPDRTAVIKVWDAATGREAVTIHEKESMPFCATFAPGGRYLLKEGPGHTVEVWDARTGQDKGAIGRHDLQIWAITFSRDGRRLATASSDGTVRVWAWDPARLGKMQKPELTLPVRAIGFGDRVAFSPDGRRLATAGEEHTITVWDATTGHPEQTLRGHTGDVFAVAFDADGRWLASAGEDTTVRLWDVTSGELLHKFRGHIGIIGSLAFSHDGRRLASGSRDRTVRVWDLTHLDKKLE
jgi:WD40 repeat protein